MDLFEAVERRHSYRAGFAPSPVPREDLAKIVRAGIAAPSGCNAQTTSFVIVDKPDTIAAIAGIVDYEVVHAARAIIVCLMEDRPVYRNMSFGAEDCAAAVENMLLAVTALGYATVWIDGVLRVEDRAGRIGELLGVPANKHVRVILPIGIPTEQWTQRQKEPFEARAWFDRHGSPGESQSES